MADVLFSYADPSSPAVKRKFIQLVEAATGQRKLKRLYESHRATATAPETFFQAAVRQLALDVQFDRQALQRIPKTGPVVVVANHPYGVLDGIVISWLIEQARPDFLVLTHALLLRAPEARDVLLPVDFSGSEGALRTNLQSRARARQHLAAGGCVVVFPAGGVSTAPDRLGRLPAVDAPWQPFTAQLIQRAKATVVPIHFEGQNSRLFQIASHVSLSLRLSLIFREVKARIGTALPVAIGEAIPFADIAGIGDRADLLDLLRARTYALGAQAPDDDLKPRRLVKRVGTAVRQQWRKLKDRPARLVRVRALSGRRTAQPRPR